MNHTDISFRKHGANEHSIVANLQNAKHKINDRELILRLLAKKQMTSKEIADHLCKRLNVISGRLSELLRDLLIYRTGETRDGAAVLTLMTDEKRKQIVDEQQIKDYVREREQIERTILDLSEKCGYSRAKLDRMINIRFETDGGLDACGTKELEQIRAGLQKKADELNAATLKKSAEQQAHEEDW